MQKNEVATFQVACFPSSDPDNSGVDRLKGEINE